MDRSVLIEYADMKEEIKDLRRRIEADRRELQKLNDMVVADIVALGKKGKKPLGKDRRTTNQSDISETKGLGKKNCSFGATRGGSA